MKINVDRSFLEINSVKDLNSSKSPGPNFKIIQVDPPDFQLNKFFINKLEENIDGLIDYPGVTRNGLSMLKIREQKPLF